MFIQLAETNAHIEQCFPVLVQLRSHLDLASFIAQVQRQQENGYQLAFLEDTGQVLGVAGFRIGECLAWGKYLYVDDLVVDEEVRSKGYGQQLFQWLVEFSKQADCEQFHLDSGVQRFEAHRFYLNQRMNITSHHFVLKLR